MYKLSYEYKEKQETYILKEFYSQNSDHRSKTPRVYDYWCNWAYEGETMLGYQVSFNDGVTDTTIIVIGKTIKEAYKKCNRLARMANKGV